MLMQPKDQIKIIYLPGFGGNMLTYLFSLDPITVPHIVETDNVDSRANNYDFNNTRKYSSWNHFHHHTENLQFISTSKQKQVLITRVHPIEFAPADDTAYFIANLSYSDFANYWLVKTKQQWGGFPKLRPGEFERETSIRAAHNPVGISIDCFLNPLLWQDEYIRISHLMNLPLQLDAAKRIYYSWYGIRVAQLQRSYSVLPAEERPKYLAARLAEQAN